MKLMFAEHCAWRASYLYDASGRRVAHIGVDPHGGTNPTLFGSIGKYEFRFRLPHVPWMFVVQHNYSKPASFVHRLSQRFYHSIDGRY